MNWLSADGSLRTTNVSSQPGPLATAPTGSAVPDLALSQLEVHLSSHQQPQQQVQAKSSAPQAAVSLPTSQEEGCQGVSEAKVQSCGPALHHGSQQLNSSEGFPNGAVPGAAFQGALSSQEALHGAVPNGANPAVRASGCTGVTVSKQAPAHQQEASRGQGHLQVKVQDYAPAPVEALHAAAQRAAQHAQHAQHAATWAVEQLPEGQYVCVMQDGAKLSLEQLYYTLEHVGKSLPEDKFEALSMMIKQLTEHGEEYEPQSGPQISNSQ